MERMAWSDICRSNLYRGRWVALDGCEYDSATGRARSGAVVDADDELDELCQRVADSEHKHCAILFCETSPGTSRDESDAQQA
jgi:hypothetical protein